MSTVNAFAVLGIIVLTIGGLVLACWFVGKKWASLPLFLQLLNLEQCFSRSDTRVMLHDLRYKTEAAMVRLDRLEQELRQLRTAVQGLTARAAPDKQAAANNKAAALFALYEKGYGPEHIAGKLKMGRGEVELFLALQKKLSPAAKKTPGLPAAGPDTREDSNF